MAVPSFMLWDVKLVPSSVQVAHDDDIDVLDLGAEVS
jgi:hypothetical protein